MFTTLVAVTLLGTNLIAQRPAGNFRNQVASRAGDLKQMRHDAMQDRKDSTDSGKARREAMHEKFQEIKNERKRAIVSNLQEKFGAHQQRWGEHWTNVLSRLSEILAKVVEVGGTTEESETAQASIDTAQAAIDEFLAKEYSIEFEDEETVGENVRQLVQEFKEDSKVVFELIKTAKDDVKAAARVAKGENNEDEE